MHHNRKHNLQFTFVAIVLLLASTSAMAQKKLQISANAMGTSTQLGRVVMVDIRINEYSTAADQTALLEAFAEKGSQGIANALDKMSSKGRIAITGTLGYDVNYVREFTMPDGSRKIRFVTDRPIRFAESWAMSRSSDYSLSMGEIILSKAKGKSTGILLPVAEFKIDAEKHIEVETFRNPWTLNNIKIWK